MASSGEMTVGYWGIRGAAGLARNLLAYLELPFQNKSYSDGAEWFGKDKQQLGFEYPNLPYLIDGDKKITESTAIAYYIALRAGKRELIGETDEKFIRVQQAFNVAQDLHQENFKLAFSKGDFKTEKEDSFTKGTYKNKLETFNKRLEGQDWLIGQLTIADFKLFEAVDFIHEFDAAKLDAYPNVLAFHKRFTELPQIKAFRQSDKFLKTWLPNSNWSK